MKLRFTEKADKDYARMPPPIRKAFAKQLRFLLDNRNHPSPRAPGRAAKLRAVGFERELSNILGPACQGVHCTQVRADWEQ